MENRIYTVTKHSFSLFNMKSNSGIKHVYSCAYLYSIYLKKKLLFPKIIVCTQDNSISQNLHLARSPKGEKLIYIKPKL